MDAGQMYNEFEIAYEAIASQDAPGYEAYEVSILLSEAQDTILKQLIGVGIENDDKAALILGPFIETDAITTNFGTSSMYPDVQTVQVDPTEYWAIMNERMKETISGDTVDVKPVDHSYFAANIDNPYKKPSTTRYFWRWIEQDGTNVQWNVAGPTSMHTYYISFLDKPDPIIVPGVTIGIEIDGTTVDASINTNGQDCAYSTIIHREIVSKAAFLGKTYIGDPEGFQLLKNK